MRDDGVNCEELKRTLRGGHELSRDQSEHIEDCESCLDVFVTAALDAKPEVQIPADFATWVAEGLPARQAKQTEHRSQRHWGLITAAALVTVLLVVCFAGSKPANSWVGQVFVMLVASEIAGLALWLGPRRMG